MTVTADLPPMNVNVFPPDSDSSVAPSGFEALGHARDLAELLDGAEAPFDLSDRPELAPLVNGSALANMPLHRWFRYREAYSPLLADQLGLGRELLDPFCGGGSALVGAAQAGRRSFGIDLNPLAVLVARVKLRPLAARQLARVQDFCRSFSSSAQDASPWPLPALSIVDKVFEPEILACLRRLRTSLEEAAAGDGAVHDFLLLAWLAILEPVGSYFKEGNGIKYRNKKRLKDGYIPRPDGWQQQRFGDDQRAFVLRAFARQLTLMLADAAVWEHGAWNDQEVVRGSALHAVSLSGGRTFDSILFSPPYANRFDYFESLKVELWFGGFVQGYNDLNRLRKASVRSHLGADMSKAALRFELLEKLLAMMDRSASSWRMGIAEAMRGYFDDMFHVLQACRQLAPRGSCHIVVGNSAFAGVIVPTDLLLAQLGLEAGFSSVRLDVARHLTVAPQQRSALRGLERFMRETVIELR